MCLLKFIQGLTAFSLANYVIGGRTKAAEGMTMDLAVTRL